MKKLFFTLLIIFGCFHAILFGQSMNESILKNDSKPNIIFILVDDLGWTDISTGAPNLGNGSKYYETPNVDKLSQKGMSFNNAYTSAPMCAPTRAALMSGQYAPRTNMYTVGDPNRCSPQERYMDAADNKQFLDLEQITMAEALKEQGYATGSFGKWHLGGYRGGGLPDAQGFDINIAGTNNGWISGSYFSNQDGAYPAEPNNPELPGLPPNSKRGEWLDDRITGEAIDFMEKNKDKPFFTYMSFFAVHTPIESPVDDKAHFNNKKKTFRHDDQTYAGFIKSFDDNIGRLINYLESTPDPNNPSRNLIENSIVIFYSDNGGVGGFERSGIRAFEVTDQYPLRDGKGSFKEGGIRVPLIIRWDNKVKENSINHTPVITMDFYPTLVKLAQGQMPANTIFDGVDITPLLNGNKIEDRELFWHFPAYYLGEGRANGRLNFRATPTSVIRKGDWKLSFYYETRKWELYNLTDDIGENINMAADHPEIVRVLGTELVQWLKETDADLPRYKGTDREVPLPWIQYIK